MASCCCQARSRPRVSRARWARRASAEVVSRSIAASAAAPVWGFPSAHAAERIDSVRSIRSRLAARLRAGGIRQLGQQRHGRGTGLNQMARGRLARGKARCIEIGHPADDLLTRRRPASRARFAGQHGRWAVSRAKRPLPSTDSDRATAMASTANAPKGERQTNRRSDGGKHGYHLHCEGEGSTWHGFRHHLAVDPGQIVARSGNDRHGDDFGQVVAVQAADLPLDGREAIARGFGQTEPFLAGLDRFVPTESAADRPHDLHAGSQPIVDKLGGNALRPRRGCRPS